MDDALWGQSIIIQKHLQESRERGEFASMDESVLWAAISRGSVDGQPQDRPMDASTRAIRFASVVGDRLWGMYALQQEQVCCHLVLPLILS
jgi:hypothetical protein